MADSQPVARHAAPYAAQRAAAGDNVRSPFVRTAQTNDPFILHNVDQRTMAARQFRDTIDDVVREFGTAEPARVRELAFLKIAVMREQEAVAADVSRSAETMIRLMNTIQRSEHRLRLRLRRTVTTAPAPGLGGHLAAKYPTRGAP